PAAPPAPAGGEGEVRRDGPRQRFLPGQDDEDESHHEDGFEVSGTQGHLDPHDIQRALEPYSGDMASCYESRVRKRRYLEGKVELRFNVSREGQTRWVQMLDSSLGAWPVEKCLLDIARSVEFDPPRGRGDATFSVPLEFNSGRQRALWLSEEQAEAEVAAEKERLVACAEELGEAEPADVWVTLYVGRRGKVQSVGFANRGEQPVSDTWAACAEQKVMAWQLTDPRGTIHKLGFR